MSYLYVWAFKSVTQFLLLNQYFIELHSQSYNLGKNSRLYNLVQDFLKFRTLNWVQIQVFSDLELAS